MKKLILSLVFLLLVGFFISPVITTASIVFNQTPLDEVYNTDVLLQNYFSFGCTMNVNCNLSGQRIYNVGIWLKKVGNPEDIRLAVVNDWNSTTSPESIYSNPVSSDDISDQHYTFKWFYFPSGVVMGDRFAYNQFFQIQHADPNTLFNYTDYYRTIAHSNDYNASVQWCKTGWGCGVGSFYFRLDDSTEDLSQVLPEEPTPFTGNIFSQTDSSVIYNTNAYNFSLTQNIGNGHTGTVEKIRLKISHGTNYEWLGQFGVIFYDLGVGNNPSGTYCMLKEDNRWSLYTKGMNNRDLVFDATTTTCTNGMTLELQPDHYYAARVYAYDLTSNATFSIAGSPDEMPGTSLYLTDTTTHPDNLRTLFMQIDGVDVVPPTPACTVNCFSNVLFLPGLEASRLYLDEEGSENQLWEPNRNLDVEKLYLNENGTSINSGIYTRDVIKETNVPTSFLLGQNIYKSFSEMMDGLVTDRKINRWESYAYDWRQSVQDIVDNGTQHFTGRLSLIAVLQTLAETSKNGKVTIITHSNGGLLAKALMVKLQEMKTDGLNDLIDHVDVLILVASPQIGTASAVPAMLHGYDQAKLGGLLVSAMNARELGRNMLSGYGLLPSREYINRMSASPVVFTDNTIPSGVTTNFVSSYGNVIDSYVEYKNFLFGVEGRAQPEISDIFSPIVLSQSLFNEAENLHNKIDAWTPPASLRVIEVAGWGLDTVASFQYYPKWSGCKSNFPQIGCTNTYILDERPIFTRDGDKTVIEPSALYLNGEDKVWVNIPINNVGLSRNRDHSSILEISRLNNYISSLIKNETFIYDSVLTTTKPIDTSNRLRISIHSPVTLGAYDSFGNFTGKICPTDSDFCYAKEEIPNSSYLEFGEGKYLNLPEENMHRVVLQGTDIGTFTYESEKVMPDNTTTITRFVDIPVTPITTAEITINFTTQNPELKIDTNSDGATDIIIQPNDAFDPISYLEVMKKIIKDLDITKSRKNHFINRIDNTIKAIRKGKIDKAKLKVERFTSILEKRINRKEPKKPRPHQLTKTDAEQLLLMLDTLLNNLNK